MKTKAVTLSLLCTVLSCRNSNVANAGEQNREAGAFRKIQVSKMEDRKGFNFDTGKGKSIRVYVSAPVLEGLSASGGSDFYAGDLKSSGFSISSSGGRIYGRNTETAKQVYPHCRASATRNTKPR